ncbi:hypothetical protein [Microcoleus sp. bin38.metabat.b11b12b14.051]|uniref:hypothetical protein n=1 Tax=Microcoleus sp. bin38.metabat.b11b12b14.051 TaxID=2742709 RepID=UPI0025CC33CB|nr:hypothetical protein [Microcoleus sp. bin38.metabat.b11b12b14.051]
MLRSIYIEFATYPNLKVNFKGAGDRDRATAVTNLCNLCDRDRAFFVNACYHASSNSTAQNFHLR